MNALNKGIIALAAITGALLTIWTFIKTIGPLIAATQDFLEDWNGTAERPGIPRRPGMMERMSAVEKAALAAKHNTEANGGTSSHDQIMQHLRRLEDMQLTHRKEFHDYTRTMKALYEETSALAGENGVAFPPWPWEALPLPFDEEEEKK